MSRPRLLLAVLSVCLALPLVAKTHLPTKNTHGAIKAYVRDAAKLVAAKGPDCKALESPEWMGRDYYVFVVGPDTKLICHPTSAGKMASEVKDAKGRAVGTELVAAAKKPGGGWVNYEWPRPGTTNPVRKSSYAMEVKGPDGKMYDVGAGGYEVK